MLLNLRNRNLIYRIGTKVNKKLVGPRLDPVGSKIFRSGPASLFTLLILPRKHSLHISQGILVGIFIIIRLQLNFTSNKSSSYPQFSEPDQKKVTLPIPVPMTNRCAMITLCTQIRKMNERRIYL